MGTFTEASPLDSIMVPNSFEDDAQTYQEPKEKNFLYWLEKGITEYLYWREELDGTLVGIPQKEIDMSYLKEAETWGPLAGGRLSWDMKRFHVVMDHFFSGKGTTLYFKMSELLTSCAGARRQVSRCISMRLDRHSDLIFGHPSCDLPTHMDISRDKIRCYSVYQFPFSQDSYKDADWQFTLGTFSGMWQPLQPQVRAKGGMCVSQLGRDWIDSGTLALTRHKSPAPICAQIYERPKYAKVWGSKIWRWHSSTERGSERVHKVGYNLVQSGTLRNFCIIAEPCIINIETGMPV